MIGRTIGLATALTLSTAALSAQAAPDSATFIRWGRTAARPIASLDLDHTDWSDLEPLGRALAGARVVALGEGVHLGHEPLAFRNRLFRYLVERQGFTAIAIESGISESRVAHRYAAGESVDRKAAIDSGFSWQFQHEPENGALVDWIRSWNAGRGRKPRVSFYGFDVPGSPGNMSAARRMQTAVDDALAYLARVDSGAAAEYTARLRAFRDLDRRKVVDLYAALPDSTRDRVTAAIADLESLLQRRGPDYAARSSDADYRWGLRHAGGARQMDGWLRRVTPGFKPTPGQAPAWFWQSTEVRDRGMAENIAWIREQEGPDARILVFASDFHIAAAPNREAGRDRPSTTLGIHLRQALGESLVTIGNLIGEGKWGCAQFTFPLQPRDASTMDRWAGQLGPPQYFLDLRTAAGPLRDWLASPQPFGRGKDLSQMAPSKAYDVLVYYDTVGPVCPPAPAAKP